jgi:hypothetical protein
VWAKFRRFAESLTDLAALTRDNPTMRTAAVIFVLALITTAFEIYSDAALTSAEVSHTAAPAAATAAIAHGLKTRLVSALHTDELKIAAALSDAEPLQEELKDFQRQVSDAGRATYNARVGAHDDLIAIAIAL